MCIGSFAEEVFFTLVGFSVFLSVGLILLRKLCDMFLGVSEDVRVQELVSLV